MWYIIRIVNEINIVCHRTLFAFLIGVGIVNTVLRDIVCYNRDYEIIIIRLLRAIKPHLVTHVYECFFLTVNDLYDTHANVIELIMLLLIIFEHH